MAELVAHEVQIPAVRRRRRRHPHEFVQRHRAVDPQVARVFVHRIIHRIPREAEDRRLPPDQRLIVALRVADRPLVAPPVGEFAVQLEHAPRFVRLIKEFEPQIGHPHRQPAVEAHSLRIGEPRHAAHVLCDGHGVGTHRVDHPVGERQIRRRVFVDVASEVVAVAGERLAQSVVEVQHARHPVEAEAVDAELVEEEAHVGEQKVQRFRFAVVEAERIPRGVFAAGAGVEIGLAEAVDRGDALDFVFDCVRVHEIDQDAQPHSVRRVDQFLELLRRAEAPGDRVEVGDVVAETAVVGVPRDRHQLHRVVSGGGDARQHLFPELGKGRDLRLFLRHADVRLVDELRLRLGRRRMAEFVVLKRRHHGGKAQGDGVLFHVARVGGDPLAGAAVPMDVHQIVHPGSERGGGEFEFPRAVFYLAQCEALLFAPAAEVADEEDPFRVRSVLPEDPSFSFPVQSVVFVGDREIRKFHPPLREAAFERVSALPALREAIQIGGEVRIAAERFRQIFAPFEAPVCRRTGAHNSDTGVCTSGRASIFS